MLPINILTVRAKNAKAGNIYQYERTAPLEFPIPAIGSKIQVPQDDIEKHNLPSPWLTIKDKILDLTAHPPPIVAHFLFVAEFDSEALGQKDSSC